MSIVAEVFLIAAAAFSMGISGMIVPKNNAQEAAVVKGLSVYGFQHLSEVVKFLDCPEKYQPVEVDTSSKLAQSEKNYCDLQDVKGQVHARRALEIAAAGGHNLILSIANRL